MGASQEAAKWRMERYMFFLWPCILGRYGSGNGCLAGF
jgi:hypothetical protein